MGAGYAQTNDHLRNMEREAYEKGNMCFRDWEDSIKSTIYFEHLQKGDSRIMSTKQWKNGELKGLLSEAWGLKMDLSKLNENQDFAAAHRTAGVSLEESEELEEGDTGASKGDKGKDKDDPEAKDYTDGGDRKGDESKTHPGEKDYTTKKGDKTKKGEKAFEDPSKGEKITTSDSDKRGSKKGDEAYKNEGVEARLQEIVKHAVKQLKEKKNG